MKYLATLSLVCGCICLSGKLPAQSGLSVGEEIRYPTEVKVTRSSNEGTGTNAYPVVEPGGFVTRKTSTSVVVKTVTIRGTVNISRGANGQEIAVLQPNGGAAFQVATGSTFRMGGHIMQAKGWKDESTYIIIDLTERKAYGFNRS
jgi:hypothetical protein